MNTVEFAALALATWRVSVALSEEEGPWETLARLRRWAGVRYGEESWPYGQNPLAEALICIWCLSPWVGAGWLVFWFVAPTAAFHAALPFAFSAVAAIMHGRGVRYKKRTD